MTDLISELYSKFSPSEWEEIETSFKRVSDGETPSIPVNGFNLRQLERLRSMHDSGEHILMGTEKAKRADILEKELRNYLTDVFSENPAAHIYIIVSCLFLTLAVHEPMHPEELTHWVRKEKDGNTEYLCPACNDSLTCSFCVCSRLEQ